MKTSFRALEIVGTTSIEGEKGIPKPSKAVIMAAKILINNGFEPGKGLGKKLDDIAKPNETTKKGKLGSKVPGKRLIKSNLYQYFNSGGILILEQVAAVENQLVESAEWVHPIVQELNNWTAETSDLEVSSQINNAAFTLDDTGKPSRQEEEEEIEEETLRELERLLEQEGPKLQSGVEELEVINLSEGEGVKEIRVGRLIPLDVKKGLTTLLRVYADIFVWSYRDMPRLDTTIIEHRLPLNLYAIPVRQQLRRMKPEVALKIKEEVEKQWNVGFLAVAEYPQWVANIVPVPKKDGKLRMCVDYRDLNRASPKDNFPLPHIDLLVDNTTEYSCYSFIDGFSIYNQIRMAPKDKEKTTFITIVGHSVIKSCHSDSRMLEQLTKEK
ncbi:hypothetical protein CR513_14630, partial [Mucuna pruriens]